MESQLLSYRNSRIHYLRFGKGERLLFCFHGYGEDAATFRIFEHALGTEYTIIAIDLPFHGNTEWRESLRFTPKDLLAIMRKIAPLDLQTVSLMGYSMGGRVALALLQLAPKHFDQLVLVAPDGLHRNFWYRLATQTSAGNGLFRYTMQNPAWFFGGMSWLMRLRLMNKSIFKFAHSYLDDATERWLLYQRWTVMRAFRPSQSQLVQALGKTDAKLKLVFGAYDRIIVPQRADALKRQSSQVSVKIIRAGHQLLKVKYANEIGSLFSE